MRKLLIILSATVLFNIIPFIVPLPKGLFPDYSKTVYYADGRPARVYIAKDEQWRIRTPYRDIPLLVRRGIVEKEDRFFFFHFGINPVSVLKAAARNIKNRRIINGGSTLTMQLARITEPKRRTLFSKFIEMLRAVQFEMRFSKEEILEYYLNLAPFGRNLVGIESAAQYYFGKPLRDLDISEMAAIVNMPQIPGINALDNTELFRKKRDGVLKALFKARAISKEEFDEAAGQELRFTPSRFPSDIPHLSDFLTAGYPGNDSLVTTVQRDVQRAAQQIIANHRKRIEDLGITNASAVVLDIGTGNVLAAIGSFDYFGEKDGMVNGFIAKRSPGSTLKPFLYALSLMKGIINPSYMLKDIPTSYSDYSPENFSGSYQGLVRAEDALCGSLNVPFIRLFNNYGKDDFLDFLRSAGIRGLEEDPFYGLSLIIGAVETDLLSLANIYRMIANNGKYGPYRMLIDDEGGDMNGLLSEGACYLTKKALSKRKNFELPDEYAGNPLLDRIYWKTGTSHGYRDALTIAFGSKFVVGVWAGNFDGCGVKGLIGYEIAAPIAFDILRALEHGITYESGKMPDDISLIEVCPLSGKLKTDNCPEGIEEYTLRERRYYSKCNFHRKFLIEKGSGLRITSFFKGMGELEEKVFAVMPSDVSAYLSGSSFISGSLPAVHPRCGDDRSYIKISGLNNGEHIMYKDGLRLSLLCSGHGNRDVFWFINGKLFRKTEIGNAVLFPAQRGSYEITAADEFGSEDTVSVEVIAR